MFFLLRLLSAVECYHFSFYHIAGTIIRKGLIYCPWICSLYTVSGGVCECMHRFMRVWTDMYAECFKNSHSYHPSLLSYRLPSRGTAAWMSLLQSRANLTPTTPHMLGETSGLEAQVTSVSYWVRKGHRSSAHHTLTEVCENIFHTLHTLQRQFWCAVFS